MKTQDKENELWKAVTSIVVMAGDHTRDETDCAAELAANRVLRRPLMYRVMRKK